MAAFLGSTSFAASVTLLLIAACMTIVVSALAILGGFVVALPVCGCVMSRSWPLRGIGSLYVSFFRGVPLLVQLMVIYYLLPFVGLELPAFMAGVIAMAVCTAAYQAENLRGGFRAVPAGQAEAARAFGYTRLRTWWHITLPQAWRAASPSIVNEMISILKASSLVSVVGVTELTRVSENIVARSQQPIQWYSLAALLYLLINLALAASGRAGERLLARGFARSAL